VEQTPVWSWGGGRRQGEVVGGWHDWLFWGDAAGQWHPQCSLWGSVTR